MTTTQQGNGTTTERQRHGKIETTETINAGEIAQRERWPDIVAFMLDEGMLLANEAYGWDDYCRLKCGMAGSGNGGEGWKQQELIIFQKKIGYKNLRCLHELADYPVPQYGNEEQIEDIRWRLSRCLRLIRDALTAAEGAAQEAGGEIKRLQDTNTHLPHPENC